MFNAAFPVTSDERLAFRLQTCLTRMSGVLVSLRQPKLL